MPRIPHQTEAESAKASTAPEVPPVDTAPPLSAVQQAGLVEAQQLANVGWLAAGLAHDLNNLLTVILGSAELARGSAANLGPAENHLRTIETAVRRGGELCRAMLACARTDQHNLQPVDANAIVREIVALLETSCLAFHRVHLELQDDLPPVPAQPAQFRQILLNLLVNAAEACGARGGRVRISTSITNLEERVTRQLRPGNARPGRFLRLRVADDGCGMNESTQERLFTPFFTRKGSGRGLGLASLVEIVRTHRGGVRVFSELQRGSIFDVYLPVPPEDAGTPASADSASGTTRPAAGKRRLSGSILIADDEDILRQSLATFLGSQGLTVHAFADGADALAHLQAGSQTDVALLDLMMPKMGGLELLTALRAAGNRTPVILMTGNVEPEMRERLDQFAPAELIAKPFSLVELVSQITRHLPAAT